MNLRQLELLRAVVRSDTMVKAAHELGLSQPAVSNAIKHLEQQMGFPLFERINNRLFPTAEARALCEESEQIVAMHAALKLRIQDFQENRAGRVRLTATPPLGHSLVPRTVYRLLKKRPKTQVFFSVRRFAAVVDAVDTGGAELGFALGDGDYKGLESEILLSMRVVCVMRPDHPLAQKQTITPGDLRGHPFIALENDNDETTMGGLVRQAFCRVGEPFDFLMEVHHSNTACVMAANGVGVTVTDPFTPLFCGSHDVAIRAFEPACAVSARVLRSPKRPLSRAAAAFLCEIRGVASEVAQSRDPRMAPGVFTSQKSTTDK